MLCCILGEFVKTSKYFSHRPISVMISTRASVICWLVSSSSTATCVHVSTSFRNAFQTFQNTWIRNRTLPQTTAVISGCCWMKTSITLAYLSTILKTLLKTSVAPFLDLSCIKFTWRVVLNMSSIIWIAGKFSDPRSILFLLSFVKVRLKIYSLSYQILYSTLRVLTSMASFQHLAFTTWNSESKFLDIAGSNRRQIGIARNFSLSREG